MKRIAVALIVVAAMLVVVAPASAATVLHGQWTGGMASGSGGPIFGIDYPAEVALVPSGNVNIAMYPTYTDVASSTVIMADPAAPPFPTRLNSQSFFGWGPAVWDDEAGTYTVSGIIRSMPFKRAGLGFEANLVADTTNGTLEMTVHTIGSVWGWETWVLYGELF